MIGFNYFLILILAYGDNFAVKFHKPRINYVYFGNPNAQFQGLRLAIIYTYLWTCTKKRQAMAAVIAAKFDTVARCKKLDLCSWWQQEFGEITREKGTFLNLRIQLIFQSPFPWHYYWTLFSSAYSRKQSLLKNLWNGTSYQNVTSAVCNVWNARSQAGAVAKATVKECVCIFSSICMCSNRDSCAHICINQCLYSDNLNFDPWLQVFSQQAHLSFRQIH